MDKVLLLDKNYLAISVISLRRAATMIVKGKVEAVAESMTTLSTSTGKFNIPTILKLLISIPRQAYGSKTKFSRKNIMLRDNHTCQYCLKYLGKSKGTIDHVMPKSRGGGSDYLNCVTCCHDCNLKKANKTPEEAGLKLKCIPKKPSFIGLYKFYIENVPREWKDYLMEINYERKN